MKAKTNQLVILIGPSGVGKGRLCEALIDHGFVWSKTATTRPPRPDDSIRSRHSHVSKNEFDQLVKAGEILEKNFHNGNWYGTPKSELNNNLKGSRPVLLEIEVNGARAIKNLHPQAITIFITSDFSELHKRIGARGGLTKTDIAERLRIAKREIAAKDEFDYQVENIEGKPEIAVKKILSIIKAHDPVPQL